MSGSMSRHTPSPLELPVLLEAGPVRRTGSGRHLLQAIPYRARLGH
jgi:hypothetical protein